MAPAAKRRAPRTDPHTPAGTPLERVVPAPRGRRAQAPPTPSTDRQTDHDEASAAVSEVRTVALTPHQELQLQRRAYNARERIERLIAADDAASTLTNSHGVIPRFNVGVDFLERLVARTSRHDRRRYHEGYAQLTINPETMSTVDCEAVFARRETFFAELERTGKLIAACDAVQTSRAHVRDLCVRDPDFREEYETSLQRYAEHLEDVLYYRATIGVEEPVVDRDGSIVAVVHKPSDRLLEVLLKSRVDAFKDSGKVKVETSGSVEHRHAHLHAVAAVDMSTLTNAQLDAVRVLIGADADEPPATPDDPGAVVQGEK